MTENGNGNRNRKLPVTAWLLGYGGVLPFVGLAVAVAIGIDLTNAGVASPVDALLDYAAIIVSFIGAVYWGVALAIPDSDENQKGRLYVYSVVPALVAWVLLFLPQKIALFGMAITVIGLYLIDRGVLFKLIQSDYRILRLHLTVVVTASLLLAAVAV